MKHEKKQQLENETIRTWSQTREMGKLKYILKYWVVFWGICTALLYFMFEHFGASWEHWVRDLIIALIIFPIGGFIAGHLTWNGNEKKYFCTKQ